MIYFEFVPTDLNKVYLNFVIASVVLGNQV